MGVEGRGGCEEPRVGVESLGWVWRDWGKLGGIVEGWEALWKAGRDWGKLGGIREGWGYWGKLGGTGEGRGCL